MKKIVVLMPCLMSDVNREVYNKVIMDRLELKALGMIDQLAILAINFSPEELDLYSEAILITDYATEDKTIVGARNTLLKWFYDSDYDFALWTDANERLSGTTKNDLYTLLNAVKNGLDVSVVFSTLGEFVYGQRIAARKRVEHLDEIILTRFKPTTSTMMLHFTLMINIYKYYNHKLFIPETADQSKGRPEDIVFAYMLDKALGSHLCPTIVTSRISASKSTWSGLSRSVKASEVPIDKTWIRENIAQVPVLREPDRATLFIKRVELEKERVTKYKEKHKGARLLDLPNKK